MKNICGRGLLLEPCYSSFHRDLVKYLSSESIALVFNTGFLCYLGGIRKIFPNHLIPQYDVKEEDLNFVASSSNLLTEMMNKLERNQINESALEYMARYMSFLRDFIVKQNIDFLVMHNDLRWQHQLAIQICKELNRPYIVTERGIFRPFTTTVDFKGVNENSSLLRDADFYRSYCPKNLSSWEDPKINPWSVNIRFLFFLMLNLLGQLLGKNSPFKNKRYNLISYGMTLLGRLRKKRETEVPSGDFIFVPLQVSTDTQLLVHSDFSSLQDFVTCVEEAFYSLPDDHLRLVFKPHPMEPKVENLLFNGESVLSSANTAELIAKAKAIITINSTVGLESIMKGKPVFVLGRAQYKIQGLVHCCEVDDFKQTLSENYTDFMKELDVDLMGKFLSYLQEVYQVPGNIFKYEASMLVEIEKRFLRHLGTRKNNS